MFRPVAHSKKITRRQIEQIGYSQRVRHIKANYGNFRNVKLRIARTNFISHTESQ